MTLGRLFIVSAPSGAGKTSLVKAVVERSERIKASVSHTTRTQRPGEVDGKNYYFVDEKAFESLIKADQFFEYANVFGNYYGTSKQWVESELAKGQDVILEIDWQGAEQVRQKMPEAVSLFILPPSRETLRERLTNRGQDDKAVIEARMVKAISEMSHYHEADYIIVNEDFDEAVKEIETIIASSHLTQSHQSTVHKQLIAELLEER